MPVDVVVTAVIIDEMLSEYHWPAVNFETIVRTKVLLVESEESRLNEAAVKFVVLPAA